MNIKLSSLNKGLVGHWTMSQDSLKGSLLGDKTPYNNDGTIYGATFATDRMGQPNKAMSFDGVDDYVDCGISQQDLSLSPATISMWIKATYSNKKIFFIDGKSKLGLGFFTLNKNKNLIVTSGNMVNTKPIIKINDWNDSQWNHIVLTYDSSHNPIGYLNGKLLLERGTSEWWGETTNNLLLGKRSSGNNFNGLMDDVRIYNRALSEPEIKTLYNSYNPNIKMKTSLPKIKFSKALKGTFVDSRDGTEYKTIKIGNQTWMAENLKYLPSVVGPATGSSTDPYYYVYDYNGTDVATAKATTNYQTYGVLYNWVAATTACPAGWHLPSDEEYKTLEKYLGMTQEQADLFNWRGVDEGSKLSYFSLNGNNSSKFNGLMGGLRDVGNLFKSTNSYSFFWSSTISTSTSSLRRMLCVSSTQVHRAGISKAYGLSVRCIRDY